MHRAFRRRARRINVSGKYGCERNRVFRVRGLYRPVPGGVVRLLQVCSEHGILAHACVTDKQSQKINFTILAAEEGGKKRNPRRRREGGRPSAAIMLTDVQFSTPFTLSNLPDLKSWTSWAAFVAVPSCAACVSMLVPGSRVVGQRLATQGRGQGCVQAGF
jgi:hypothetical protein